MRQGRAVRELNGGKRLPLGLGDTLAAVGEETIEPGDRLLFYTDGVLEARDPSGTMFAWTGSST
jgi:phosphoserine phosphatase RsbU/P